MLTCRFLLPWIATPVITASAVRPQEGLHRPWRPTLGRQTRASGSGTNCVAQCCGISFPATRALSNAGTLTFDSRTALQGPSQPAAATEAEAECTTEVHCARVDVAHQPVGVDVCGVIGTVCAHTVPVRGGFANMLVYECYSFYIFMLVLLLKRLRARPGTARDVCVDFARASWRSPKSSLLQLGWI
jgi:hypothetical protein